jgi:hypothetical protein
MVQTAAQQTIDFLADNDNPGFKVRYNPETKLISVFDLGRGLGIEEFNIRKVWSRLKKDYPRVVAKCHNSKFPNSRQKTWACNPDTAIELTMLWPGKAAGIFRQKCAQTIRRFLAGDESLVDEIRRNAQRNDPVSQLMRSHHQDQEWIQARQKDKDTRKETRDQMQLKLINPTPKDYAVSSNIINKSVMLFPDKTTSAFKKRNGISKKTPLANVQSKSQLLLAGFMNASKSEYLEDKEEKSVRSFELKGFLNSMGVLVKPLAEKSKKLIQ